MSTYFIFFIFLLMKLHLYSEFPTSSWMELPAERSSTNLASVPSARDLEPQNSNNKIGLKPLQPLDNLEILIRNGSSFDMIIFLFIYFFLSLIFSLLSNRQK